VGFAQRRVGLPAKRRLLVGASTSKPRPALVVQADLFNKTHASITVCPVTSDVIDAPLFRIALPPGARTGLQSASQVMVDKVVSVPRSAIGRRIGGCEPTELELVEDGLRRGLAL
jgi:mRNA interferase MazF